MFTETSNSFVLAAVTNTERRPNPLVLKLASFQRLPRGWSHGEGVPASAHAVRIAERLVDSATTLQLRADVFPGLNGEVAVAFYRGAKCVEVVIDPQRLNRMDVHVEEGLGFTFRRVEDIDGASYSEAIARIVALVKDEWKSPESSRSSSLMGTGADFRMWSSSTHQG